MTHTTIPNDATPVQRELAQKTPGVLSVNIWSDIEFALIFLEGGDLEIFPPIKTLVVIVYDCVKTADGCQIVQNLSDKPPMPDELLFSEWGLTLNNYEGAVPSRLDTRIWSNGFSNWDMYIQDFDSLAELEQFQEMQRRTLATASELFVSLTAAP